MTTDQSGWIQTYSGKKFDPLNPDPSLIDIRDITHALSLQCRYNGHVRRYYSVGQHSVHVANLLPDEYKLWGLLHDASEAYLGDMVAPVKARMPEFKEAERRLQSAIYSLFGLEGDEPEQVHFADMVMLNTERKQLFISQEHKWGLEDKYPALDNFEIPTWTPDHTQREFEDLFIILYQRPLSETLRLLI